MIIMQVSNVRVIIDLSTQVMEKRKAYYIHVSLTEFHEQDHYKENTTYNGKRNPSIFVVFACVSIGFCRTFALRGNKKDHSN